MVWWCTGEYGAPRLYPTVQLCDMIVRPKLPSWEETWRVFYLGFPRLAHAHRRRNIWAMGAPNTQPITHDYAHMAVSLST